MENDDKLYQAAVTFQELLDTEIILKLGHKSALETVKVRFDITNFFHLAGLHKLKDLPQVSKGKASNIFAKIIEGRITLSDIEQSSSFGMIEDRIDILRDLISVFKNPSTPYKFLKQSRTYGRNRTSICWKYLLEFTTASHCTAYIFFNECRNDPGHFVAISEFKKGKQNYGLGNERMKLLQIVQKSQTSTVVSYQSRSYREK